MRTEHYVDMESPITGGKVKEVCDVEEKTFRKERYSVHVRYYICDDSGEEFTTTEQDELFTNELYNQYRVRHGFPFPDEIRSIRERYGFNYAQISKIMGFGINQWKQYEEGNVPSESNARQILAAGSKDGMRNMVWASRSEFTQDELAKIYEAIESSQEDRDVQEQRLYYGATERGIMNGFAAKDAAKLKAMVLYLIMKEGGKICPTKLNKEMFYSDFSHYQRTGSAISGLSYRAIQYGPVPEHYATIYDNIDGISKEMVIRHDSATVDFKLADGIMIDTGVLSKDELATLDAVSAALRPLSTAAVVARSHEEEAWTANSAQHSLIPYSFAFSLKSL